MPRRLEARAQQAGGRATGGSGAACRPPRRRPKSRSRLGAPRGECNARPGQALARSNSAWTCACASATCANRLSAGAISSPPWRQGPRTYRQPGPAPGPIRRDGPCPVRAGTMAPPTKTCRGAVVPTSNAYPSKQRTCNEFPSRAPGACRNKACRLISRQTVRTHFLGGDKGSEEGLSMHDQRADPKPIPSSAKTGLRARGPHLCSTQGPP